MQDSQIMVPSKKNMKSSFLLLMFVIFFTRKYLILLVRVNNITRLSGTDRKAEHRGRHLHWGSEAARRQLLPVVVQSSRCEIRKYRRVG